MNRRAFTKRVVAVFAGASALRALVPKPDSTMTRLYKWNRKFSTGKPAKIKTWIGSTAEYDALGEHDPDTYYLFTG